MWVLLVPPALFVLTVLAKLAVLAVSWGWRLV
jgi:hypothetical protein